ncbi:hypothetical protein [Methylocystis sp. S23]|jgi:hypothetical protein
MKAHSPFVALAFAGALSTLSAPASATSFCNLKKTKDGFVALRAGPSPDAKLLAKMTTRDEVMVGEGQDGKWVEVTWWRGDDRLSKKYGGQGRRGWMNGALLGELCG